jgi:hypothetical protein
MQETSILTSLFTIKIGTLIAGLLGASIRTLRKTEGSLQARIAGYISAIITIVYIIPFINWFLLWKFQIVLDTAAENFLAFVLGMLSQTITENFLDDPLNTIYNGTNIIKKLKRMFWNGEPATKTASIIPTDESSKSEEVK